MAYKSMTVASCANKTEIFCRIRDFLCARNGTYDYSSDGIGWTLFDSSYAANEDSPASGDWFVLYSSGESGDEDLYFKFDWVTNYIKITGYLAWNPSTHAGTTSYTYATSNNFQMYDAAASFPFWIDGSLDLVVAQYEYSTNAYTFAVMFGAFDPADGCPGTRTVANCSSALTSGSGVNITVDSVPADWEVGMPIIIRTTHTDNIATAKIEVTTITAISGNVVTCNLTNSYTSNSKLSSFFAYACSYSSQGFSTMSLLIDGSGTTNTNMPAYAGGILSTSLDPSAYMGKYVLQNIVWCPTSGWPIIATDKIRHLGAITSPMVIGDYVTDGTTTYRVIFSYSNAYYVVKEV